MIADATIDFFVKVARGDSLVPEIVYVMVDPTPGRAEPDIEVHALLDGRAGLNLGRDHTPGALAFQLRKPARPEQRRRSHSGRLALASVAMAAAPAWSQALTASIPAAWASRSAALWARFPS